MSRVMCGYQLPPSIRHPLESVQGHLGCNSRHKCVCVFFFFFQFPPEDSRPVLERAKVYRIALVQVSPYFNKGWLSECSWLKQMLMPASGHHHHLTFYTEIKTQQNHTLRPGSDSHFTAHTHTANSSMQFSLDFHFLCPSQSDSKGGEGRLASLLIR